MAKEQSASPPPSSPEEKLARDQDRKARNSAAAQRFRMRKRAQEDALIKENMKLQAEYSALVPIMIALRAQVGQAAPVYWLHPQDGTAALNLMPQHLLPQHRPIV